MSASSKKNYVNNFVGTDTMKAFEEHVDVREHALDFIDTYSNKEIAQMVREKILTLAEVEQALRKKKL